jgi:hypothetical protein
MSSENLKNFENFLLRGALQLNMSGLDRGTEGKMSKNTVKFLGVIALIEVFGFTLIACEPEPDPVPPQPGDNADTPMDLPLDDMLKGLGDTTLAESLRIICYRFRRR